MPAGVYERKRESLSELQTRFWSRVHKTDFCWVWTWHVTGGYGRMTVAGKQYMAHRLSYEWAHGPIQDGLVIDHLCRNRSCVNPAHLEAVTNLVNILRGHGLPAREAKQSRCKRGHPLPPYVSGKRRFCQQCNIDRSAAHYRDNRDERLAKDRVRYRRKVEQESGIASRSS